MVDIYQGLMDGLSLAQAGGQVKKRRTLGSLYQQAIANPDQRQSYIGQMAALDPEAANTASDGLYKMDDNANAALGREAAIFSALPSDQKPQAYVRLAQHAQGIGIPVPMEYNPAMDENIGKIAQALTGGAGAPSEVQTFAAMTQGMSPDEIMQARRVHLGLDPRAAVTQPYIFDPSRGVWVSNPGYRGGVAPQAQAPQSPSGFVQTPQGPVNIDPSLPPEIRAQIAANPDAFAQGGVTQGAPVVQDGPPPASRAVPVAGLPEKPQAPPTQLQLNADARDAARLALAQQAAARANAPKPTDDMKAQKIAAARSDALDSVNQAISGIDSLTKSEGFNNLGTYTGDLVGMIPHTKTRDATNALETIKNQVLLATLSKLKALSATGASGFGALSNQEGRILQNSIANLETAQSHDAIVANLKTIRETLQRAAGKIGAAGESAPSAPQSGGVDDLLSKYGVK